MTTSNTEAINKDEELRKQVFMFAQANDIGNIMNLIHQYGLEQRIDELEQLASHVYANKAAFIEGRPAFGTESARTMSFIQGRTRELQSQKVKEAKP